MSFLDVMLLEMSEISSMPLNDWFDTYNKQIFDNKLPKIPIILRPLKASTGYCSATKNNRTGIVTPDKIVISNYFKREEEEIKAILIHEMIHLFHFTQGFFLSDKSSHGHHFDAMLKHAEKVTGLKIPKTDQPKDTELSDRHKGKKLEVILLHRKGMETWSIAVYSQGTFLKDSERLKEDMQGISDRNDVPIEIFESDIAEIFRYPRNRRSSNSYEN
jgi:hypothetical protein